MSIINQLTAISPIDGRYWDKCSSMSDYFSEYSLIKYRVLVEIEYFIKLTTVADIKPLVALNTEQQHVALRKIYQEFNEADAIKIKNIEKVTNHDIKAVEYFIKEKMTAAPFNYSDAITEFIHFGLTSQDVNNTAIPLSIVKAIDEVIVPQLNSCAVQPLQALASSTRTVPMLAHTHGQPATPTTVGKEFMVFLERLQNQIALLEQCPHTTKFGGATGNLNAHYVAYPNVDWIAFGESFVASLHPKLKRSRFTTQIEHYDNLAALFDGLKRINTILIDLCRDIWTYISMEYFGQRVIKGEVGSSTMPHKVNPIDFENAEGNMGVANALYEHLAAKLPISRLQRDLTDSTVLRTVGVPLAHSLLAFKSLQRGLGKLVLNEQPLHHDLDQNWAVISEAIQTILRREGYPKPYEALKELTRVSGSKKISQQDIHNFIDTLQVSDQVKQELKVITPFNYLGFIPEF
ncbi:adenylosuccinate lyase [Heterostelium album PN500]|uniref:Adenylosuccinate lyase n=1 Tax=Heterostelium pallidum (strain ATCC 26659 / Pp 5 / PN500) TaxID=670386 RepID=D3BUL3_HETP5|nr:adenylosuccinate lyase [Heterostelium album PN500]EFA74801.1 adenylosuccinate lyase [Heterostelium album PN500]|eukprot:XP_020426935.1 adenylosuccinate lyase [Heterostelium album PN500]